MSWEADTDALNEAADDAFTAIQERKQAIKAGLPVSQLDERIARGLDTLKSGIGGLELKLEEAERAGRSKDDLKKWESAILALSKQSDRLEFMSRPDDDARSQLLLSRSSSQQTKARLSQGGSALTFSTVAAEDVRALESGELVQLQSRIMDEQDAQLDQLSETLLRHKDIGLRIGDELDHHIDLLEQTEADVDATEGRLGIAGRRLRTVTEVSKSATTGNTLIGVLIVILVLVIIIAKWT
ncbi:hypothetical protein DFJ73DRAFT_810313 [Zopfochytrium polystomum]|nr:hypothetical protein DFJ73DRAFT_810313 [Zopfochytrium polystomum]